MTHTIEFRTIDYDSRTTEHLINWKINNPSDTVIPRTGEFIMLPKDSTACVKRYKYEIKNILRESFDRIVCYVVECNYKDINFRTDEEVSSKSSENEDDRLSDICVECNSLIDNEVIIPRVGDKLYSAHGLFTVVDIIIWSYTMDSAIFVVEPVIKRKKI